jgi:hypothetical protein
MTKTAIILGLLLTGWQMTPARADDDTAKVESYNLEERCGKRAEERFRHDWGDGQPSKTEYGQISSAIYESHYSPRLNKCFVLYRSSFFTPKDKSTTQMFTLLDANTYKEYGEFSEMRMFKERPILFDCHVLEEHCTSEQEWKALIRPYMED